MKQTIESSEYFDNDEIAVSAVKGFCMSARPLRSDVTRLVDLVIPLLKLIGDHSRREIAAALALSEHAPKPLLLALCDYPVAICSPILTRSQLLNDAELLAILSQNGGEHARAIARRAKLSMPVAEALRAMQNDGVHRALDLRQRLDSAMPDEQAESFDRFHELLRNDAVTNAHPVIVTDMDELVSLACDPDPAMFHTAVADSLAITLVSAAALCSNPTSKNLLYMLRFIDAPLDTALRIFNALAPNLAVDPAVVARFEAVFTEIPREDAVHKVWSWRSDDLLALAREALAANDPGIGADGSDTQYADLSGESYMKVA